MKSFYSYLLLASALNLWCADTASAVPVQGTEPAIHVGAPPAADVPHWRTFTSAEGRFSVLLPSAPEAKAVVLPTVHETLQLFICRAYSGTYLVQYVDRPAKEVQILGAEKILTLADDAFIKRNRSSAIIKRRFMLDGYPGHEIIATRSNGSQETDCAYLVGIRRYTLITLQRRDQVKADPKVSAKFLNSFTLLPAKLPEMKR
jgi:hypothetical protein